MFSARIGFWSYLASGVVSVLLGLLSISDYLGTEAELAASQEFRRVLQAEPDLAGDLAALAR